MRLGLLALLLISFSPLGLLAQGTSIAEQYLFAQANAERAQRGLPELRWNSALFRAASAHAQQMAERQSISHQYPGEADLAERARVAGAHFNHISENVAEAPTAVRIHDAWMNSPGHRANLLDPQVTAIGIRVLRRNGQLYAVQDFERENEMLSLDEQEERVGRMVGAFGAVQVLPATEDARQTCGMKSGWAGNRPPLFVVRYTAGELSQIPGVLKAKLSSGKYHEAIVGACAPQEKQPFTTYSIAVMLYP